MSASAILKLQKVGFTAEQVEALAEFVDARKPTCEPYIGMDDLKVELRSLRYELRLMEHRITARFGVMMTVFVGILLAAIRFMPPGP